MKEWLSATTHCKFGVFTQFGVDRFANVSSEQFVQFILNYFFVLVGGVRIYKYAREWCTIECEIFYQSSGNSISYMWCGHMNVAKHDIYMMRNFCVRDIKECLALIKLPLLSHWHEHEPYQCDLLTFRQRFVDELLFIYLHLHLHCAFW